MSRWALVQHVAFEGPGTIGAVAAEHDIALDVRRMDLGHPLPSVEQLDGLVVMGGPMNALDDADHPHLAAERALLGAAVGRGLPVLGVCLGAQLLAAALGGVDVELLLVVHEPGARRVAPCLDGVGR